MLTLQFIDNMNPRATSDPPYAIRTGAGRPEGSYPSVAEAFNAATRPCFIVTVDGWWHVARVVEEPTMRERYQAGEDPPERKGEP
jgi:hypothetical protein